MKRCPRCETKNEDSSNFCKQCGSELSSPSFQDKRRKVLGEGKKKFSWMSLSLAIFALVLGGTGYWFIWGSSSTRSNILSQKVTERVDYTGQTVAMTDIQVKVENGKISVPLDVVMEKKIIRFEYEGHGLRIPLLSYITLAGRAVTAISMCEPCQSTRFHIKDKTLVCNACYTEWNLESLKGIKGGCMNYPPEIIPSTVEKGKILIDEKVVLDWKPRV
jgi:hypothetical protein